MLRHADTSDAEPALHPKFNLTHVDLSVHPQPSSGATRGLVLPSLENVHSSNTGLRPRPPAPKHDPTYSSKAREYPNIDQIINPTRSHEPSLHQPSVDHSAGADTSMSFTLQMAALSKPHGLLTYNETEKNKQAALFMPRSLLNKKLKHQK